MPILFIHLQLNSTNYKIKFKYKRMDACESVIEKYLPQIIMNSGRSLFFKGRYEDCINMQNFKYSLVEFGKNGVDNSAYIGLCLPQTCSDYTISRKISELLTSLNSTYEVYTIQSNPQTYNTDISWKFYITISMLVIILIMVFWSTINALIGKNNNNIVVDSFNVVKNLEYFKIRENEDLNIFDGVRALSMMWVIFGHTYSYFMGAGITNFLNLNAVTTKPFYLLPQSGLISVDIFLTLGGFFLSFVFLRQENVNIQKCLFGILQRALRIWPAYILTMMFYDSIFMQLGKGIFWFKAQADVSTCQTMWRSILFVANLVDNGREICLGWSWYLQVDFQLFIFGMFILFLYKNYRNTAIIFSNSCAFISVIFVFVFTLNQKIVLLTELSSLANFRVFMLNLYFKPWGRCTPYLMGLLFGILFFQFRESQKRGQFDASILSKLKIKCENKKTRLFIEWFGISLMAFVVFIPRPLQTGTQWPQYLHSLYWTLSKPIFLFGLILTVLPTTLGFRYSFFNLILTPKIFHFIAKVSFCTYLVHLMIVFQVIHTRNYNFYYTTYEIFVYYAGILTLSLFFGTIVTVTVELPFGKLQKELMNYMKNKNKEKVKEELNEHIISKQTSNTNNDKIDISIISESLQV